MIDLSKLSFAKSCVWYSDLKYYGVGIRPHGKKVSFAHGEVTPPAVQLPQQHPHHHRHRRYEHPV